MKEDEGKGRVDRIVEDASVELASRFTRRSFLGRAAAAAGAVILGGGPIILGEKREAAAADPAAGCFGTVDVNVCYSTWVVTQAESGQNGVVMRKGPSMNAPPIYNSSGNPVVISVGGHFGRSSKRDGNASCSDPGPRGNVNGFLWGYSHSYPKQGWIPYYVGGVYYASGVANWENYMCGPAAADFDCRDGGLTDAQKRVHCPNYNGCGGDDAGTVTLSGTYWTIGDSGSNAANSDERYYLRYAKNSTTFGWLVPGDKIKRLSYSTATDPTWSCIYAYCCAWIPYGCRGWVRSDALGSPGSYNSCSGGGDCPSGSLYV